MAFSSSPSFTGGEKKNWWRLTNKKIVDKLVRDARILMAAGDESEISSALNLLESALSIYPRSEQALELKARSLLYLRRFRDVADMLQDYIPSLKMADGGDSSSDSSTQHLSRERVKLISSSESEGRDPSFKCFSVSDLKKKVIAGIWKDCKKEEQWRYLVLGQACCSLGLMEDAMVLLQTGKRLATAAFRRESICLSDDSFSLSDFSISGDFMAVNQPETPPRCVLESETITNLLSHIKLLLRRRSAALAALDAGLYSEAIRHFSKIVDSRRGAPQGFLSECYMNRALAYQFAGRIAESIGDCNRSLALDPSCIPAMETRARLLESARILPECLHDLEHLKLLYNTILRDRKLPGPAWKRRNVHYREIPAKLSALTAKNQELKQRVPAGEMGNVDYYALMGLRRGCSRSELERAHLLLCLRHTPDKATIFIDRCELAEDRDLESIRERAKMSALLLYRLLQKGYANVMTTIMDEEAAEKRSKTAATAPALQAAQAAIQIQQTHESNLELKSNSSLEALNNSSGSAVLPAVFCRDISAVSNLLPLPVKYEALSC